MSRKIICALLILSIALSLCSCATSNASSNDEASGTNLKILCTLFPQYDWIRNITKNAEGVEVSLIITNGTDPHSYQPTAKDILNISNCDIIVYVGGDSDAWVKKAIERSKNQDIKAIALTELSGIELHDISASSHAHEGDSHEGHSHEGHSHSALDEHLYLSVNNARRAVSALTSELCTADPTNRELYLKNSLEYTIKLNNLTQDFEYEVSQIPEHDRFMLFADRFPFVYLLSDYDIHYSAAFEGCTTDVDADFDTIIRLIREADEHDVRYIIITDGSDGSLANTIISSTKSKNQKIITLNSMQSITQSQIDGGATYISLMKKNINGVREALGIKN